MTRATQDNTILYLALAGIGLAFFLGRKKSNEKGFIGKTAEDVRDIFKEPEARVEGGVLGTDNPSKYEQPESEVKGIASALYNFMEDVEVYISDADEEKIYQIAKHIKGPNAALGVAYHFGSLDRNLLFFTRPFRGNLTDCLNELSDTAKDRLRPLFYYKLIF
jgi:hypothetical protein